jgi:hypothetical protein
MLSEQIGHLAAGMAFGDAKPSQPLQSRSQEAARSPEQRVLTDNTTIDFVRKHLLAPSGRHRAPRHDDHHLQVQ